MELMIFLLKAKKRMRTGSAAMRVAAMRPAQSGLPCGVCYRKTPSATVRTRLSSVPPTSSGQK